jgi:chloramphenicol O-acetyltransferase
LGTPTQLLTATAQKKLKKSHPTKNFNATAQNTLSFFLPTHDPTLKKMKECFRQRFNDFVERASVNLKPDKKRQKEKTKRTAPENGAVLFCSTIPKVLFTQF